MAKMSFCLKVARMDKTRKNGRVILFAALVILWFGAVSWKYKILVGAYG
jgi:hypothetical protein